MRIGQLATPFCPPTSSVSHVISQLNREHLARGGSTLTALSAHREAPEMAGEVVLVDDTAHCRKQYFSRFEGAVDHALGASGASRRYAPRIYHAAAEALGECDLIVVHEGGRYALTAIDVVRRLTTAPVVLHLHTRPSRSFLRSELARLLARYDAVVAVSADLARETRKRAGSSCPPVSIVHNGIEPALLTVERRLTSSSPIVFAGELAPHKGLHQLLRAMDVAGPRLPVQHLQVFGGLRPVRLGRRAYGDVLDALISRCREHGHQITLMGRQPRAVLALALAGARLVVVPSLHREPYGMVAAEAMACGAPVLLARRGGLVEVGGDAALYVDPADVSDFGDQLVRALTQPLETLEERAQAGRALSRERTWSHRYEDWSTAIGLTSR